MPLEGYIEDSSPFEISGWVYERADPDRSLDVEIWNSSERVAIVAADVYRKDLQEAGKGTGRHRFCFHLPDGRTPDGDLRARVPGRKWFIRCSSPPGTGVPPWHAQFQHTMEYGLPEVQYGFTETPPASPADTELAARLIRAWRTATADGPSGTGRDDMWTENERLFHGSLADLLHRDDASGLAEYLREVYARPVTHGIFQGERATDGLAASEGAASFTAALFMDFLASLAEAVGVLRVECVEQLGHYGENLFADPGVLIGRINEAVGFNIVPPVVAGRMFGIRTSYGLVHMRDVAAVWAGLRLREVLRGSGRESVCEIGGGVGNVAYVAWNLGIRNYTIIDLPNISLVQGWCLARALPQTRIVLQGEPDPGGEAIRILPTWRFRRPERFGVVFNQDSFPEMHPDVSTVYLDLARDLTKYLLSINQEAEAVQSNGISQCVVQDLTRHVGGYRRVYRFPHWLRRGYVEELYEVTSRPLTEKVRHRLATLVRR